MLCWCVLFSQNSHCFVARSFEVVVNHASTVFVFNHLQTECHLVVASLSYLNGTPLKQQRRFKYDWIIDQSWRTQRKSISFTFFFGFQPTFKQKTPNSSNQATEAMLEHEILILDQVRILQTSFQNISFRFDFISSALRDP